MFEKFSVVQNERGDSFSFRQLFPPTFLTENGFDLLNKLLTYDPKKRITAAEAR
jgi:hypothetical protein